MAPKKGKGKEKSKKSKSKGGDGRYIGPAIMPRAAFTAVPRTPPLPREPLQFSQGLSSTLLNSSMLSRMFATPNPSTESWLSDDGSASSLDDYETMASGGYATVGQDGYPGGERQRAPTSSGSLHNEVLVSDTGEPLYSQPNKLRRRHSSRRSLPDDDIAGSSAMRRFNEEDEASFRRGSRRGSRRSRRSRSSVEEQIESQMIDKVYSSAMQSGTGMTSGLGSMQRPSSGRSSPYSHAASPRLNTLRLQNADLLKKQRQLEQQLAEQQQRQQELVDRLVQRGLLQSQDEETVSLLQETQNSTQAMTQIQGELRGMTDRTIKKTEELQKSQQERINVLEQEKQELIELNEQLQMEIFSLRKKVSYRADDDDEASTETGLLRRQLNELKDESTTLKSSVHRLNVELSRYQAKFRPLKPSELKDSVGLPGKGSKPQWLIDTKYLAPLFVAYDDLIQEKDEAVREYREDMEVVKQTIEDVLRENQRLHLRIEQTDATAGPVNMTEWRQLQEQCKLVLEENQLLMEQLDMQQNKARDMHRAHVQEITRMSKKLVEVDSEKSHYETQFEHIKHKLQVTENKTSAITIDNLEDQVTAIADLKRMLEDEKVRHKTELENYLTKIQTLSAAKKSLSIQMEDIKQENKELSGEVKALQKAQRKSHRKVLLFQTALEEAEMKAKSSEHYLRSVVRMAENTAKERDLLAQSAHDKEREKKLAINKLIEGNVTKNKMEEKMKLYKNKAAEKLEKASLRMREQDDDFNVQRQEFQREILHLRNMLQEREHLMEAVVMEKKCVEDDLETMWQVASRDNREMKDTLRKNVRKLAEHEGMRGLGGATDDLLLACTDDEAQQQLPVA